MTWDRVHARNLALEAAVAAAARRTGGRLAAVDAAVRRGAFASHEELLLAVFRSWQTRLLARLDAVVEREDGAECDDVAREVAAIAHQAPELSAVVAAHLDDPALAAAWRRCAALVGMATGLPMETELAGQLRGAVAGLAVHAA